MLDPYRPPVDATPPRDSPEDRASNTARAWFLLVAIALVYFGAKALELRSIMWESRSAGDAHSRVFHVHALGMFAGVVVPALFCAAAQPLLPHPTKTVTRLTSHLASAGPLAWAVGSLLLVTLGTWARGAAYLRVEAVGLALVTVSLGITATHHAAVLIFERARTPSTDRGPSAVVLAAALVAMLGLVDRSGASELDPTRVLPVDRLPVELLLHANLVAAIALSAWLWKKRPRAPGLRLALFVGIGPAVLLRLFTTSALTLVGPDILLHETYFAVGSLHAAASTILLVFVAMALCWAEPLTRRRTIPSLARAGTLVLSVGLNTTTILMLRAGARGMARRFTGYLDVFQPMQRFLGVMAAVSALGVLLVVAGILGGGLRDKKGTKGSGREGA
jgi:hypothetical protein